MSELISALERIDTWVKEKQSRSVFQPGLSRKEIDELTEELEFQVPDEVYKLYQWCNGSSYEPITVNRQHELLPLEKAVQWRTSKGGLSYGEDWMQDDSTWFPIFSLWCDHAFYVVILGEKDTSIVRNYDPECESYEVHYSSLTDLLLHSAEWLELAKDQGDGCWEVDSKTEMKLQEKYRIRESGTPSNSNEGSV